MVCDGVAGSKETGRHGVLAARKTAPDGCVAVALPQVHREGRVSGIQAVAADEVECPQMAQNLGVLHCKHKIYNSIKNYSFHVSFIFRHY